MRTDQLDVASGQSLTKRIAFGGSVVDQTVGYEESDRLVEQRLNESDLGGTCAIDINSQRQPSTSSISLLLLPRLVGPTRSPLFRRGERAIGNAFISVHFALPIQRGNKALPSCFPDTIATPLGKAPRAGGVRRERTGQVFPASAGPQ
jgi:hypothetical protein